MSGSLDLTGEYGDLIKKIHSLTPIIVGLSGRVTKKDCIDVLAVLRELRVNDLPAFETKIRGLRDERKKELRVKKDNRSPEATNKMKERYNNNIKTKP